MKKLRAFWSGKFDAEDTISVIPYSSAHKIKKADYQNEGSPLRVWSGQLPEQISQRLIAISKDSPMALFILLLAGVKSLLYKYTNEEKVIVAIPAVRTSDAPLMNEIILIKQELNGADAFKSLIGQVHATVSESIVNQNIALQTMAGAMHLQVEPDGSPLFHTVVSFNALHTRHHPGSIVSDIELAFERNDDGILLHIHYRDDRYDQQMLELSFDHLVRIYSLALFQPELVIDSIDIMSDEEKSLILQGFNNTSAEYPRERTIHELFEEQAQRTPERIAVLFEDERLTYRELNEQANCLARTLRAEGVGADVPVAIMAERSLEMIVGIYAILKAGGAYVPIDPEYPAERIRYIAEDSGARLLLTQSRFLDRVPAELEGRVLDLNEAAVYAEDATNLPPGAGPRNMAYVIYTSGSTGKPKGAAIEHHSVLNRILWMHKRYPMGEADVILQKTTFTFDVSVWELFWWALVGSSVCLLTPGGEKNPELILQAVSGYGVTTMHFVPAMLHAFLDYAEQQAKQTVAEQTSSLRHVFASGEALPPQHVARFQEAIGRVNRTRLVNLYGPTEATVDVSYFDCEPDESYAVIPIGKPVHNTRLYILKEGTEQLQPVGVAGELCIAGVQVARGYLNRPELTAEKFTADPFAAGERMYRTGDLARWLPDGNIEYLGRIDHQVKIRGYRIELGELETELLRIDPVQEAVVVARDDGQGQKLLCAYFVASQELTAGELREALSKELPSYMMPTYFMQVERMPLTANGKIDRKALPAPEASVQSGQAYVAPRTQTEEQLVRIWQELLGLEKVGVKDNFFDIGGHSLRAATLAARIHKEMNKQLELREVFEAMTVEQLARTIESKETKVLVAIPNVPESDYYPVSPAQKRLYVLSNLEGGELGYNMSGAVIAEGPLQPDRLEDAFRKLIARHESLRTSFHLIDGEPVQRVHREAAFALERLEADGKDVETLFYQFVCPFDLAAAPLLRARLFTQSADRHLLLVDMHHIVSDGVSLRTFLDELARLYNGEELAPLRIQYKDYAVWQQERMRSEEWGKQEQYWLQTFQGEIPTLDLKTDYPRPAVQSFAGDKISFAADSSVSEGLQKLASRSGSTLYMVLLAAYTTLLHKYTGQEDVVVGTPVAGRHHADLEPIIGMFVNTLALRNYPSGNKTFLDFVGEVKEQALGAFDHPDHPFEELVNKLNVRRDMSRNPLFDTMFELRNAEAKGTAFHDVHFSGYPVDSAIAKFDLTLEADFDERGLTFTLEYATALYSRETAERLARHFLRVLEEVVQSPDAKLADIEIMTGDEKAELLEAFSGDGGKGQEHLLATPFHVYFERQAAALPEQVAVVAGDAQLTYRELNERGNRLARTLQTAGIGRESIVGILADRSADLLVAVLGVWKAGGAYVPLDPDYPSERIGFMLQDSGATVLLTQTQLKESAQEWLAEGGELQTVLCLDEEASYDSDASNLPNQNVPQDLAYVIYTSGTTGRPKGVMIEHGSYINTAIAYRRDYRLDQFPVRLLQLASFSFDVFVGDIARALYNGGLMVIVPKEDRIDPLRLYGWIRDYGITVFESTPALIVPMMEHIASQSLDISALQLLITSSDSCSVKDYRRLQERYGSRVRIINAYGVTEAAIDSSYYDEPLEKLPEAGNVPIGKPLLNARFYIVDAALQPVPIGVAGELLIGGPGVARGYKNRPELNEEKFIASPFIEGERLYRTGDLASWMSDGNVDFIGRMDHQVKIRGYRIELGEIETAILQFAGVKQAVVVDRTDERGQKYLCGYAAASEPLDIAELQAHLQQSLPSHMVPAQLVELEKLPLTPNGKVDRKALPEPEGGLLLTGADYEAPRTEVERTLASIWQAVLGVPAVGIRDNYFELGGDSIKSLQVSSRLYQSGYKLEIKDLFQNPTIGGLSPYVQPITRMADQGEAVGAVKLTPVKWWFFEQEYANPHHHNQAVLLYREQGFQEGALRRSISRLVEHHDALRIVIRYSENGPPLAWNRSTREGDLYSFDLYDMSGEVDLASAIEAKANEIQSGISLTEGPFVRVGLFRTQDGDHLLIAIHHLAVDGVSWRILFEDLASAYEQALKDEPIRLPQKTDSFQLWAEKLSQYAKGPEIEREQAYWHNVTERGFEALPKDHEGELSLVGDSDTITVVWTEHETERLLRYANQAYNTEINDLLLTSLGLAVQRWTGMNRVAVSLEGHGREPVIPDIDISRTVGWFTSQYPVVLDMSANDNLQKSIVAVKEGLRGIPNKGIGYGIWRYLSGRFEPQESGREPEISFNYLGQFDQDLENGSLRFSPYSSGDEISRKAVRTFVLDINGLVSGGVLSLTVSYSRKQYRKETMERFAGLLQSSLREVVAHCAAKTTPTLTPSDVSVRGMTVEELELIVKDTSAIAEIENIYVLTPMQQGMLFHALLDEDSGAYFEQTSFDIIGYFDVETFRKSFEAMLQRHEIFRTNVYNGWRKQPLQVVYRHREADFAVEDIRGLSEEEQLLRVKRLHHEDRQRGFDLTRDALIRVSILRTGDESYHFLWSSHHILMDGWCLSLVTEEVFEMYFAALEQRKPKLEPVTPYSRYIEWLEARDRDEAAAYWRNYLSGYGEQTLLPSSNAREQGTDPLFGSLFCHLGKPLTEQINRYARQHQVTVHTLLQTAWGILLHRYNGTNDAVFGSVVSGRPAEIPGIERMIGLFINTVPVRIRCEAGDTFTQIVTGVQRRYLESNDYDSYPLFEIQALTEQKQELVNHIMVFENFPVEDQMSQIGSGEAAFKVENVEIAEQTNYDFNLIVAPGENLLVRFEYNTRLYHEADVQRIQAHLTYLLEQVVANPDIRIHELELVSGPEKEQILHAFNDTAVNSPRDKTIYQLLEEQTMRTPEQVAVYCEGQRLTYRELNERANRLARTLRSAGVQRDRFVGLMVERSLEMIVGVFAILKAGGAYVPIDPQYPEDRIRYMLEDSGAKLLLTQERLRERIAADLKGVAVLAADDEANYDADGSNLEPVSGADDLAYVIYTSGTTGKPKGVMLEHHGLTNLKAYYDHTLRIGEEDRALLFASLSFDAACWEIFQALFCGATLYVPTKDTILNYQLFETYMAEHRITVAALPPTYAVYLEPEQMPSLRILFTAGSASSPELVQKWKDKVAYYNGYGPTENSVATSIWPVSEDPEAGRQISIGRPMPNHRVYIVDRHGHLLPAGVAGELCVAGAGLARGYLDRPELTAEAFVTSRFSGERMYRTGDLARWLPDGRLEYLGRIDHQVKIRGYRIELGEVEAQLAKVDGVQEAIVLAREDASGQQQLVAYFVAQRELTASELRAAMSQELPNYMIPSYFVQLAQMPLTPNDKIDRKALPAPEGSMHAGGEYVAPRTTTEAKLVNIWQDVLGLEKVSVKDNFFELGGHSLRATALASKVRKELNMELPLRHIFQFPTVEQLAEAIGQLEQQAFDAIPVVEERECYPVSSVQKRLFILHQLEGAAQSYNMPSVMGLEGALDRERFEETFRKLIARHETLRTGFELVDGEPVQRIYPEVDFAVETIQAGVEEAKTIVRDFIRPFDLAKAPLLRVGLVELASERYILMLDMHHIVSDGVSADVLVEEFARLYSGEELPALRIQYKDYAVWQQSDAQKEQLKRQEAYWLETFRGELPVLEMPTDYARPAVQSYTGDALVFRMSSEVSEGLKRIAAESGATLYMVLLAAYTVLLQKYTAQEDIIVGTPIAGRTHADLQPLIGMFVNTLAIRSYPAADKTFLSYLKEVKETTLGAFERQDYPFEELVDKLKLARDLSRNPLFDTMFTLQNTENKEFHLPGLRLTPYPVEEHTSKFDLSLDIMESGDGFLCGIEYATALYKRETIERIAKHFEQLLVAIVSDPAAKIASLGILTAEEKAQIGHVFNPAAPEAPENEAFHALFEKQAERTPEATAVVYENDRLTYRELNERANRLARTLQAQGVKPNQLVGILADRSTDLLVGALAVWKAGGAYVPLDPDYPSDRIQFMLEDSAATVLLTQTHLQERARQWVQGEQTLQAVLCLEDEAAYAEDASNVANVNEPHDLAYVIYTSGTTGRPKGVMIEHRSLVNTAAGYRREYRLDQFPLRLLQLASFSFDVFVGDIARTLYNGGTMVLCPKDDRIDPARLHYWISKERITIFESTPALIVPFMDYVAEHGLDMSSMELLITSSDSCSVTDYRVLQERFGSQFRIINAYGVTEAAIDSSLYDEPLDKLPEAGNVPIGKAALNAKFYIVDAHLNPVPVGVLGELCIGGIGVARGYLNRLELTEEKFVDSPFVEGERLYRTGDLARWMPDGNVDFIGRIDNQAKIRGYRIETGEIETQMLKVEGVREAIVVVREDAKGQKVLCAYFTAESELKLSELRSSLSQELPGYMIPSYFMQQEQLPLTANGKIDRKALPAPDASMQMGVEYVAPRTPQEAKLASIWQEVLGLEKVGMKDNFFELGGHSLSATLLVGKVHKEMNVELPLREVFRAPTIEQLAKAAESLQQSAYATIPVAPVMEYYPVTSAQKRIYLLSHQAGGELSYNMPTVLLVKGELDRERLEHAFLRLIERHEALRTGFGIVDGRVVQRVYDDADFILEFVQIPEAEADLHIRSFFRPFDLQRPPLIRVRLIELEPARHLLLIDMHHIITDGVSSQIIVQEVAQFYNGQEPSPLTLQYKDYAVWQQEAASSERRRKQEEFWLDHMSGALPVLDLPIAYPRPAQRSFEGANFEFTVEPQTMELLLKLAAETGTTMYMVLLAAYTVLLSKYSGQEDIIIGSPVAGRLSADLEGIVGMFVNTIPLRNYPAKDKTFLSYLQEVKERTLLAFEHQEYPLEELVESLNVPRNPSRNPLFDAVFMFDNLERQESTMDSLTFESYAQELATAKFDLTLTMNVAEGGLLGIIEYSTKLFNRQAVELLSRHFTTLLAEIGRNPAQAINDLEFGSRLVQSKPVQETIHFTF